MAIKEARGVTTGRGTPQRYQGRNGDITIRHSNKGKRLYVKMLISGIVLILI